MLNVCGLRSGSIPTFANVSSPPGRVANVLRSIFRFWLKASLARVSSVSNVRLSVRGDAKLSMCRIAESTLGGGRKALGGTFFTIRGLPKHATMMLSRLPFFVSQIFSATSRWMRSVREMGATADSKKACRSRGEVM